MALTNNQITAQNFKDFYNQIRPYLNGTAHTGFTPIGTIISVMGNHAPLNYLICNGQVINIADYPELASYFNQEFGSINKFGGDGITTFGIPDLRGEFLRGSGTNSHTNQGNGAEVGVHQDATEHPFNILHSGGYQLRSKVYDAIPNNDKLLYKGTPVYYSAGGGVSSASNIEGNYTSRPTNTSVLYCIATKNIFMDAGSNYSTDEQVVGTWIDGKPIYQKTFTGLSIDLSGTEWYNTGLDATNLVPVGGCAYAGGNDNYVCYVNIRSISNKWHMMTSQTMGTFNILTIQYTKTTD